MRRPVSTPTGKSNSLAESSSTTDYAAGNLRTIGKRGSTPSTSSLVGNCGVSTFRASSTVTVATATLVSGTVVVLTSTRQEIRVAPASTGRGSKRSTARRRATPDGSPKKRPRSTWAPKSRRSATKVWQFPSIEESAGTARLLKEFLSSQKNGQWPHGANAIRNRLNKLVEAAGLDLPDRTGNPDEKRLVVPHALRHAYGCRLVKANIGEGAAMKQMRHQNADVFRWYSDVRDARVVSAMADAVSTNDSLLHE